MPFIRFLRDYTVKAVNGATYTKDQIVECSVDAAGHFTRRFVAELCEPPAPKEEPKATKAKPKQATKAKAAEEASDDEAEG